MLSAAKKRYLFAIYELGQTGKPIRSKDIASSLKLKPPSVSKMLNALSEDDLIEKEFYGTVTFTQSGAAMANQLYMDLRFLANTPQAISTEEAWGEGCLHSLLELLALLPLESGEHFPFYLNALYDNLNATDIILVTCYLDDAILRFARDKTDAGIPVRLYVLDPDALPAAAGDLDVFVVRAQAAQKGGTAS